MTARPEGGLRRRSEASTPDACACRRGVRGHATAQGQANGYVGRVRRARAEWPTEGRRASGVGADGWSDREWQDEVDPFGDEVASADDKGRTGNRRGGDGTDRKDGGQHDGGRAAVPKAIAAVRRGILRRAVWRRVGVLRDGRRRIPELMSGMGALPMVCRCRQSRRYRSGGQLTMQPVPTRRAWHGHSAGGDDTAPHHHHQGVYQSGHATPCHAGSHVDYVCANWSRCQVGGDRRRCTDARLAAVGVVGHVRKEPLARARRDLPAVWVTEAPCA